MVNNQDIRVSIIIPTYNREEILPQTVDLILEENFPDCEIILIHQRPRRSEQFQEFLKRVETRIRYLVVGWASVPRACNFGAKKACGEIILMLDDDIIPYPNLVPAHLKNYEDPEIGAVAGKILIPHPVKFPEHVGRIGGLGPKHETFISSKRQYVETGGGGNMSFRRSVFEKVGGFDTNFIQNAHRFESDFCYRLRKLGYLIMYDPEAVIQHLESKRGGIRSWKKEATFSSSFFRNEMLFYLKNKPDGWVGRYLWLDFSQRVPSRNLKIFFWRSWAFLCGILWGAW
ncbi:MAG: glycosyltransferase, partial [candidate division Zixibacteria bacterium]|nr:glycosyltransferase [candidate division Zixibacteria bacterium]